MSTFSKTNKRPLHKKFFLTAPRILYVSNWKKKNCSCHLTKFIITSFSFFPHLMTYIRPRHLFLILPFHILSISRLYLAFSNYFSFILSSFVCLTYSFVFTALIIGAICKYLSRYLFWLFKVIHTYVYKISGTG